MPPVPMKSSPSINQLALLSAFSLVFCSVAVSQVTWDGGGDTETWSDADNWGGAAIANEDLVIDGSIGAGFFNFSGNNVFLDYDGLDTTIDSLTLQGFSFNATADRTHDILDSSNNVNTLTIEGTNSSGYSIQSVMAASSNAQRLRIDTVVNFTTVNPIIHHSGDSTDQKRLLFNRDVNVSSGLNVTITNEISAGSGDSVTFQRDTTWDSLTHTQGGLLILGGNADFTLGGVGTTVTTATAGVARITFDPAGNATETNENDFVLGTGGSTQFFIQGGGGSSETVILEGEFTGGSSSLDLRIDTGSTDDFIFGTNSLVSIDSELLLDATGDSSETITLNGQIQQALGGFTIGSGRVVDGAGTITFDLLSANTAGADNFGNTAINVDGELVLNDLNIDLVNLENLDRELAYQLLDFSGGTQTGTFANASRNLGYLGSDIFAIEGINSWAVQYSGSGAVTVLFVPEPSRAVMLLLGFSLIFARRRR